MLPGALCGPETVPFYTSGMAKVIRRPGRFLQDKRRLYLAEGLAWLVLGAALALATNSLLGLTPMALAPWSIARYTRYAKGEAGERLVSQALETLDDTYYIVHDAQIPRANIDHVVLGPNGIFVLETKHYSGLIHCQGDRWWRARHFRARAFEIRSPSRQVKRNAALVRERIKVFERTILKDFPRVAWVQAIVVFTNPHAILDLHSPMVPVVSVERLVRGIMATRSPVELPAPALTKIGLALLGMKNEEGPFAAAGPTS